MFENKARFQDPCQVWKICTVYKCDLTGNGVGVFFSQIAKNEAYPTYFFTQSI